MGFASRKDFMTLEVLYSGLLLPTSVFSTRARSTYRGASFLMAIYYIIKEYP